MKLAQSKMGTRKKQVSDSNQQPLSCLYASLTSPLTDAPLVSKGHLPYNALLTSTP